MGVWGTSIFSADISADAKDDYLDALKAGRTDQEAEDYATREADILDEEEYCAFWTALAMIQWQYGRLSHKVKEKAIQAIDNGGDCALFEKSEKTKRQKVLQECKETLILPLPERKKVKIEKPCRISPWKLGDIFAYRISEKNSQNAAFFNKYFVFIVTDVKHCERAFEELSFDEVCGVVLNKVFDKVPQLKDLEGVGYMRFFKKFKDLAIGIAWLTERPLKQFVKQTTFIGHYENFSPIWSGICSMSTFLQNIENTLVEVYQDEELNSRK
jgi:hypothetical protein